MTDLVERLHRTDRCYCGSEVIDDELTLVACLFHQSASEIERLRAALEKIHKLAVAKWSEGTADGWLKIMQIADPSKIALTKGIEMRYIDVVFDGPPGPVAGRFVEVENERGASISVGEWVERADGYWVLRIPASDQGLDVSNLTMEGVAGIAAVPRT